MGGGGFGAAVASLLDTYSRCLGLLKRRGPPDASHDDISTTLGTSLGSDRTKIQDAYLFRLKSHGSRFDEGDASARSRLRKLVRRLNSALESITVALKGKQPVLVDIESLVSLSGSSSTRAVRTMDSLSSRVSSRTSLVGGGSEASRGSRRSRGSAKSRKQRPSPQNRLGKKPSSGKHAGKVTGSATHHNQDVRRRKSADQGSLRNRASSSLLRKPHRESFFTVSSDSTQLGEVKRKWSFSATSDQSQLHRRGRHHPPRTVSYPVRPFSPEQVEDKRRWWNIFGP